MPTIRSLVFGSLIAAFMVGAPIAYYRWHDAQCRNFRVAEAGVLYRCGQLPIPTLERVVAERGIRTVISFRDGESAIDREEEAWVQARGLKFVRIPHRPWLPDASGQIPAEIGLAEFRRVMDDPANYPVLVHCFAGIHRTGAACAIYRIDYQGWTNAEAMAEMRAMGYTILDDHADVKGYFSSYRSPRSPRGVSAIPASREVKSVP